MDNRTEPAPPPAANPPVANSLAPPVGDRSRIEGLEAQVDDLKYTLNNVLHCFVALLGATREERHTALVADARAALRTKVTDYLG